MCTTSHVYYIVMYSVWDQSQVLSEVTSKSISVISLLYCSVKNNVPGLHQLPVSTAHCLEIVRDPPPEVLDTRYPSSVMECFAYGA